MKLRYTSMDELNRLARYILDDLNNVKFSKTYQQLLIILFIKGCIMESVWDKATKIIQEKISQSKILILG